VRDTETRVDIEAGSGGLFVERHAETDLRKLDEHFDRLRVGLVKANRHPNEEFGVNFDHTFVIVCGLERLQDELDLRQEEVLVFNVSSAYQSVEEVQVNRFLDLHHDAREKTAALRRNGQPRWLHLNI
jgi:DNA-binding GntR family transcriptional regulator